MEIEVHSVCSQMGSVTGKGWQPVLRCMGVRSCMDSSPLEKGGGVLPSSCTWGCWACGTGWGRGRCGEYSTALELKEAAVPLT